MNDYTYATLGRRSVSFVIDDLIVSFLFIAIFYGQITSLTSQELMVNFIVQNSWILLMLKLIYHTFFIWYNGMTVGKYIAKIKAVDESTDALLPLGRALIRALVRVLGESFFYFTFLFAIFDKRVQTLHDKVAKCVVVTNVKN
jgi:uncharacterized RDD family membrane protein YckC